MRIVPLALTFCGLLAGSAAVAQDNLVVVELFTSQGCSACPPADEILQALAQRDNVIALALHVDYWDYMGWVDLFGKPEHTARQQGYARAAGSTTLYTPQMVVGGTDAMVGSRLMAVMEALEAHAARPMIFDLDLARQGDMLAIVASPGAAGVYDVHLVRYAPLKSVDIIRGENAGHVLDYANVVTQWDVLGQWDGRTPLDLQVPVAGPDEIVAIIQQQGHGPIMAAARLE